MPTPLTRPASAAAPIPSGIATIIPRLSIEPANRTTAMPRIDPTERSMPRARMTNVIPIARMPTIDTCRSTFMRLGTVKKRCDRNDAAMTRRISAASTPRRCHVRAMAVAPRAMPGLGCKSRGPHDRSLRGFSSREGRRDPPATEDNDSIRKAENFLQVGGDQHDRHPICDKAFDRRVNLLLRTDVNAASGLIQDEDPRLDGERPTDQHLLLVPAAQRAYLHARTCEPDVQSLHHISRVTGLGRQTENSPTGEPTQIRDCGVLTDGAIEKQALRLAVLRNIGDSEPGGCVRAPYSHRPAKHLDRSRDGTAKADDRARQLRASSPHKTGQADNLALADRQSNI